AVDGGGRRRGVQRAEHQVSCLGRLQRDGDGLEIAHFAQQHDVRIFTQRRAQRLFEGVRVFADLALIDQAFLVRMYELHRIFDGNDVIAANAVDVVDEASERGALA